jgi:hypothetical protein
MKKVRLDAKAALEQAAQRMKWSYDKHAQPAIKYATGNKVYIESTNIKSYCLSRKLDDKCYSPFEVVKKIGESAYELNLPDTWPAIHPVFNKSYFSLYKPMQYCNQQKPPPPPPVEIKGEPEYNVKDI